MALGSNGPLQVEPTYPRLWGEGQVREFANQFRREYLHSLRYLTDDGQRAFLDSFIMGVININHRESIPVGGIIQLRTDLRDYLHLGDA